MRSGHPAFKNAISIDFSGGIRCHVTQSAISELCDLKKTLHWGIIKCVESIIRTFRWKSKLSFKDVLSLYRYNKVCLRMYAWLSKVVSLVFYHVFQPWFGFLTAVFGFIIFLLFVFLAVIKYSISCKVDSDYFSLSLKNQNIHIDSYSDNFHLQNSAREWLANYWMLSLIQDMHLELQYL